MAYSKLTPYQNNGFTVSADYTDTVTTPKNISVPDLSASDFALAKETSDTVTFTNVTGANAVSSEGLKQQYTAVADVYRNTDIDAASKLPSTRGIQVMNELTETYHATASDKIVALPCMGRLTLRIPTGIPVTQDLVEDLLARTIAASFLNGSVNADKIMKEANRLIRTSF